MGHWTNADYFSILAERFLSVSLLHSFTVFLLKHSHLLQTRWYQKQMNYSLSVSFLCLKSEAFLLFASWVRFTTWRPLLSKELNHLNTTFESRPILWRPSMSQERQLYWHTILHFPCWCWFILDYVWRRRCKDRTRSYAMKKRFRWRTNQIIHQGVLHDWSH